MLPCARGAVNPDVYAAHVSIKQGTFPTGITIYVYTQGERLVLTLLV